MSDWFDITEVAPTNQGIYKVRVLLTDGSEINCYAQTDGDFYWKGGGTEMFILDFKVTHWMPLSD